MYNEWVTVYYILYSTLNRRRSKPYARLKARLLLTRIERI